MILYLSLLGALLLIGYLNLKSTNGHFLVVLLALLSVISGFQSNGGDRIGYLDDIRRVTSTNAFPFPQLTTQAGIEYAHTLFAYISGTYLFKPALFFGYSLIITLILYLILRDFEKPFGFIFAYYCFCYYPHQTWYIRTGLAFTLLALVIYKKLSSRPIKRPREMNIGTESPNNVLQEPSMPLQISRGHMITLGLLALTPILFHASFLIIAPLAIFSLPIFRRHYLLILLTIVALPLIGTSLYDHAGILSQFIFVKDHYNVNQTTSYADVFLRLFFLGTFIQLFIVNQILWRKRLNKHQFGAAIVVYVISALSLIFSVLFYNVSGSSRIFTGSIISAPFLVLLLDNTNLTILKLKTSVLSMGVKAVALFYSLYWFFSYENYYFYQKYIPWRVF